MEGVAKAEARSTNQWCNTTYTERECPVKLITYLFGARNAESKALTIGVHSYAFCRMIPPSAPYSVEGKHGYIRYSVDANLDIPHGFDSYAEKPFTVCRTEDLNLYSNYGSPVIFEKVKNVCSLSLCSKPLIMRMKLPKQRFAVGEMIPVNILLVNGSSIDISDTTLTLVRIFSYYAKSHNSHETAQMDVKKLQGVKRGQRATFDTELIVSHNLLPTSDRSRVFKVFYRLELRAGADTCGSKPTIYAPIVIGHDTAPRAENAATSIPLSPFAPTAPLLDFSE